MYKKDDYVVFGIYGVCRVSAVGENPFDAHDSRSFYTLTPILGSSESCIYVPADGGRGKIRNLITREKAEEIMNLGLDVPIIAVPTEKQRRDTYKEMFIDAVPESYLKIMRTVAERRLIAIETKRHLPDVDVEYEMKAKRCLFGELSMVLGYTYEELDSLFR